MIRAVAAVSSAWCGTGRSSDSGGTRLLHEIGFRLLREGHVPLLLGPYSPTGSPTTLRTLLVEIFQKAVLVAELLDTSPPQVTALTADPDFKHEARRVVAAALAELTSGEACVRILETLSRFGEAGGRPGPLSHDVVRLRLAADLSALAEAIVRTGEPFGPHTRVVVLADSLHTWANALDELLAMVRKTGLGTAEHPVPLIGTSSLTEGKGPALKTFSEEHSGMPGFAFPQLTALPDGEATLGFLWVLLHPWQHDRDPEYRQVYVSARGAPADRVHRHLKVLKGNPTKVEEELYMLAQFLCIERHFLADDDDAAYRAYLETHR